MLKPGDKVRVHGAPVPWTMYNGLDLVVVNHVGDGIYTLKDADTDKGTRYRFSSTWLVAATQIPTESPTPVCNCDLMLLLRSGCCCGAFRAELEQRVTRA